MGSATAWWLTRAGRSVLLLEQYELGHSRAPRLGGYRVLRFSYQDRLFGAMAMEAQRLWREAEAEAEATLLVTLGGFDFGEGVDRIAQALAACGATHEWIDGTEGSRRYPRIA